MAVSGGFESETLSRSIPADWNGDETLQTYVRDISARNMDSYVANPDLVQEHVGIEDNIFATCR